MLGFEKNERLEFSNMKNFSFGFHRNDFLHEGGDRGCLLSGVMYHTGSFLGVAKSNPKLGADKDLQCRVLRSYREVGVLVCLSPEKTGDAGCNRGKAERHFKSRLGFSVWLVLVVLFLIFVLPRVQYFVQVFYRGTSVCALSFTYWSIL